MMNEKKMKIDPHLLTYIYESLHRYPDNLYDITKIKKLDCNGNLSPYDFYYENVPVIIEICDGAWDIIGEMKNLKRLIIQNMELPDFSFLEKCSRLEKLALIGTNFSDCMPLQKLTNLKSLTLEHIDELANTEVLSSLNCRIEDEADKLPIPYIIDAELEIDENWKDTNDIFAEYLNYIYIQSSEEDREDYPCDSPVYHAVNTADEGLTVTKEVLDWLYLCIQQGKLVKLLAMKKMEDELECRLTVSCKEGWTSIIIEEIITEDEYENDEFEPYSVFEDDKFEPYSVFFYYHNLSCPNNCRESPAYMEEGMSVPKALSCDNLYEAAEIILYFIKTGKLYPMVEWYGYLDWV